MTRREPELTDIVGDLRNETDKAYRVFDGATTQWIPKSQVEHHYDGRVHTFTMPTWLAKEKGFI